MSNLEEKQTTGRMKVTTTDTGTVTEICLEIPADIKEEEKSPLKEVPKEAPKEAPQNVIVKIYHKLCNVKWVNVIVLLALHIGFVAAIIHVATHSVKTQTALFSTFVGLCSAFGISVGMHRHWAHRAFKARYILKLFFAFFQTASMNGSIMSYSRDHRLHHKYSDTDADPKNPARGLFYSHIGWWMLKKSQIVLDHAKKFDNSDLMNDKLVYYQHKFYKPLYLLIGFTMPTLVPYYCWNEDLLTSFYACVVIRTTIILHQYFTVNSIAHVFGYRPYDFRIMPAENRVAIYLSMGDGNHNFHHAFPYDYASCEKQWWEFFNPGLLFIEICRLLGLIYDCKRASPAVIKGMINRIGQPALVDPPRSLCFRICYGFGDWMIGLFIMGWVYHPIILYKQLNGLPVFVF